MDLGAGEHDEGDRQKFCQQLSKYEMHELRMMYEYFREDLVYIVQVLDTQSLLVELKLRTPLNVENYESLKRDLGVSEFAKNLVQDVLEHGRKAVIGFLECLYSLQTNHTHHNLLAVVGEIQHVEASTLKHQILLDEQGYSLTPDIQEIQAQHKRFLLEKTQKLMENMPPGTTLESESFPISERYVNLVVVSTENFRSRAQHELIEIGEKHESFLCKTQRGLERVSLQRLFRWCHQIKGVPNITMISGVPGVGKTTLMQKLVYDWVNGNLYQRFSFVFFFKFRELNQLENISLEEMILHQYPHLTGRLEDILKHPEQLLFIFDGLDESRHVMDFVSSPLYTNTKDKQDLGVILVNLLRQTLLKGCSVLMTSRPAKLASIDADIFQLICEVMGFFHEERKRYFVQFFGNEELSEKAFNHVRANEALYTFCYIPSYCWIICTVLSMCFKNQQAHGENPLVFLPKTVTQLFVTFISHILANHTQERNCARNLLMPLGWLAEHGVMNHIIVFEERDLVSFSVDASSHVFTSFMVESAQSKYANFSFLHLTIQEFMAALAHHIDYDPVKFQKTLDQTKSFRDGRAEIFLRFLSGLSDGTTKALLKPFLHFSTEASKNVITWLHQLSPLVKKLTKDARERRETLNIFNCLFESRNTTLAANLFGQNPTFDFSKFNLTPLDCTVLVFILTSCAETRSLDLEKCYFEKECWERLSPGLHAVQTIRLLSNEMKDEDVPFIASALNRPDCKIQNLSLSNNLLTHVACKHLACKLSNNQSLKKLDLSYNNLSGPCFRDLMVAMSTCAVESLLLYHTRLTHEDSQFLELLSGARNLTFLSISYNNITDAGSRHIINLIENSSSLQDIRVRVNGFSQEVQESFKGRKNKSDMNVEVV